MQIKQVDKSNCVSAFNIHFTEKVLMTARTFTISQYQEGKLIIISSFRDSIGLY
jgi:hypothetical protein